VCSLTEITAAGIVSAMMPGIKSAALCAIATYAGEFIATLFHIQGTVSLLVIVVPPAILFCTLELSSVWTLATATLGREVQSASAA
jgi:hypothetical protein